MKIYFDGTLIDDKGYADLTKIGEVFNQNFKLGATVCETYKLTIDKEFVKAKPNLIEIYENDILTKTLYVDEIEEDDITINYSLVDGMINFNIPYDASSLINEKQTTLLDIFKDICLKANIKTDIVSFYGDDIIVTWYDNTLMARDYLGYIAELNASNFYMSADNKLIMKEINREVSKTIGFDEISDYEMGQKHVIQRVVWDNSINYWEFGKENGIGQQIYNVNDFYKKNLSSISVNADDCITIDCVNNATVTHTYYYWINSNKTLKTNTDYNVFIEIKEIDVRNGNPKFRWISADKGDNGQFNKNASLELNTVSNNSIYSTIAKTRDSFDDCTTMIRGYLVLNPGDDVSITFRYSVIKDLTITPENFVYEPYITGDTYYINADNVYVLNEATVEHIYNLIKGFTYYNFKSQNIPIEDIELGDVISFKYNDEEYPTIFQYESLEYSGGYWYGGTNLSVDSQKQEETQIISTDKKIRSLKTIVDRDSNRITLIATETENLSGKVTNNTTDINNNYQELIQKFGDVVTDTELTSFINSMQTQLDATSYQISNIQTLIGNGVEYIRNTSGTFDENGLTMEQTGANTKTVLNQDGVDVKDVQGSINSDLLFAGYVSSLKANENEIFAPYEGQTIVYSKNSIVENYMTIGKNSRIEDYEDGTGIFYLGG